jgi:hypothetical protein
MSPAERPALVFALFAGVTCFAVAAFAPQIFNDADTYWHIAAGGWMLDHRAVLYRDVFSFTFAGKPWDAHEWLSEILIAGAFRAGGWSGLHLLVGAAIGAAAAIVAGSVRARVDTLPALLVSVLGLACTTSGLLARPHVLALPLLALWTLGLVQAREGGRRPAWWLLAVMVVWANLHGSFAFGLALAGAFALEAVLERREAIVPWALFLAAATLAAMLTPQGFDGLVFPIRLMAMGSMAQIGEWAPSDLATAIPLDAALLALLFATATRRLRLPWVRAAIVIGLAYMAVRHQRHQMLFGIVVPLVIAPALAKTSPAKAEDALPAALAPLAAVLLAVMVTVRVLLPATRGEDRVTPADALASVPSALRSQPVLSAYDFGGYLIFEGVRPFIDGRTDMYGDAFMQNYDTVMKPDRRALNETLRRWHIAWTLLPPGPAARMMDSLPGWRRAHSDTFAVVHIRE